MTQSSQTGSPELQQRRSSSPVAKAQYIPLCKRPTYEKTQAGSIQDECEQEPNQSTS